MNITILDWLENTAKLYPDKIAYADVSKEYTFMMLSELSKIIATNIIKIKKNNSPVMIYMEKSADCIVAFLGVLYSGGFYSPVDTEMPVERVRLIYDILKPKLIICDKSTIDDVQKKWGDTCICVDFTEMTQGLIDEHSIRRIQRNICKTDLMYVLFTSGSTGTPKGVAISHRAVIDFTEWICDKYNFDTDTRLCNQAPFYFDASIPDILIPLKSGASTYIPPKNYYTFPKKILSYIDEKGINTLIWVPSAMKAVIDCHAFDTCVPGSVNKVIFCGEVLPGKYLNAWKKYIPSALFVNMYGPTEITYACTYFDIHNEYNEDENIPLGYACENCKIILLDENDNEAAVNAVGEICVLGDCLSSGYYNDFERTEQSFGQNPLNNTWYERMYRTGDFAYRNEEGILFFVGRKDSQIKKMGYRIELGEIENSVISLEGVESACCLFDHNNGNIIAIYAGNIEKNEIETNIKNKLPKYMHPDIFERINKMPLNMNGKIDRVILENKYVKRIKQ